MSHEDTKPVEGMENSGIETIFGVLEEKVEKLAARLLEVTAENTRLRVSLDEAEKDRNGLKGQLAETQDAAGKTQSELAEKLSRYEVERGSLRSRIEKLVRTLEEPAPE